jgi:hypothetical protein
MRPILLLSDETTPRRQLLQDAAHTNVRVYHAEASAGCNCDRWGHPCPGCIEANVNRKRNFQFTSSQTTEVNRYNT